VYERLDIDTVLDLLNEIEAEHSVWAWQIDGVPVWPWLRPYLAQSLEHTRMHIRRVSGLRAFVQTQRRRARKLTAGLPAMLLDRAAAAPVEPADVIFLTMSTARRFVVDGKRYDVFSDAIRDLAGDTAGLSPLVLEFCPSAEYRLPRYRPSHFIQSALDRSDLRAKLAASRTPLEVPGGLADALDRIERASGLSVAVAYVEQRCRKLAAWSRYFEGVFRATAPKMVVGYGWWDDPVVAAALACSRLGIPTVDVQHGIQGAKHAAYSRWPQLPESGVATVPNVFWVWGDDEKAAIEPWTAPASGRHRVAVAGNPSLTLFRDEGAALVRSFDRQLESARGSRAGVEVLVALAGRVPEPLVVAMRESPSDWYWWLRMHPAAHDIRHEVEDVADAVGRSRVNVSEASELPVYSLIRRADVVVSERSSTLMEAIELGVGSVLIDETARSYYAPQIEAGWIREAYDPATIIEAARSQARRDDKPKPRTPDSDPTQLFTSITSTQVLP